MPITPSSVARKLTTTPPLYGNVQKAFKGPTSAQAAFLARLENSPILVRRRLKRSRRIASTLSSSI